MAFEVVLLLTALIIMATICIGVSTAILSNSFICMIRRGPRDFLLDRLARCGDHFSISLMGKMLKVIGSPEIIKFVLSTAHESFPTGFAVQIIRLLDHGRFADARHSHFRKVVLSAVSGEGLQKLVPFISSLAEKTVKSWENQVEVNSVEELYKFVFSVGMPIIWRDVEPGSEEMDQMRNEISRVAEALLVLPINIPGFSFHKAMKTREVLVSRIQSEISRRRKAGIQQDDVLNGLMSIREVEVPHYDICCIVILLMFATLSTATG